jgi:hypothetical protein
VVQSIVFHDLLYLCLSLSSDLFLAIVKYFVDWLHTSLLSSMMVLCTDIRVHTYICWGMHKVVTLACCLEEG